VIASSRNQSSSPHLVDEIRKSGGHWIDQDVTAFDIKGKKHASELFGQINIVVNNAECMMISVFEDLGLSFRAQSIYDQLK
tara:strand:+ start:97 stop:339 length:243 start_codon:yes stop_codon:yes gene_type:complete